MYLAVGASAPLPQRNIAMRPCNAKTRAFQALHTAVVFRTRAVVALRYRVRHRGDDAGEECRQDNGETHADDLRVEKTSMRDEACNFVC
jgi:hypothetical protein